MPSIAESPSPSCISKKRRRDEDTVEVQMKLSSPHQQRNSVHDSLAFFSSEHGNENSRPELDIGRILPRPRRHDSKRQKMEVPSASRHGHDNYDENVLLIYNRDRNTLENVAHLPSHQDQRKEGKADLSPCHICHRKPTAKHELDSFADCEGCGKRTCWICIRECLGMGVVGREIRRHGRGMDFMAEERKRLAWHGRTGNFEELAQNMGARWEAEKLEEHRGRVCSRCCVERGTEGDVWCLGCLRAEGGG